MDQSHIQPLQQYHLSNAENNLLKSTQTQINSQLKALTTHYHSLAEQTTQLKSYSIKMALNSVKAMIKIIINT